MVKQNILKVGDIYPTNHYGDIEIIKYTSAKEVLVRFISSGFEVSKAAGCIRCGQVKDLSGGDLYRFHKSYTVDEVTGCWNWSRGTRGSRDVQQYGAFNVNGDTVRANRWCLEYVKGESVEGLLACHTCDNSLCVNPDHLYAGTHQDNMDDMVARDRQDRPYGNQNGRKTLKLT